MLDYPDSISQGVVSSEDEQEHHLLNVTETRREIQNKDKTNTTAQSSGQRQLLLSFFSVENSSQTVAVASSQLAMLV